MSPRLTLLQQMLEETPGDSFVLFAMAKECEGMGDNERALALYLQLRDSDPGYVGLYYHLGKLFEKASRREEAIETYRTGMTVARAAGNTHTWNELNSARQEIDEDDDF